MQTNQTGDQPESDGPVPLARRLGITESRIHELRSASEKIDEIFADLEECCSKVQQLEQTGGATTLQARDYQEMRDQLERELERHLAEAARTSAGAQGSGGCPSAKS